MATVTDLWLNIDPTDEDSWTFGTTGNGNEFGTASTNYQVFDENGNAPGEDATNAGAGNLLTDALGDLMCEDNCVLLTTADSQDVGVFVITLQDNDDSQIADAGTPQLPLDWETLTLGLLDGEVPVTITEQGPNTGVFGSYDESDTSNVVITDDAERGTSANIDYNETPATILVGFAFGSISIDVDDDEWNSGEEVPVTLVDADANRNSRADEDLDLFDPNVALIPSLSTGDPFTLAENDDSDGAELDAFWLGEGGVTTVAVEKFSKRGIVDNSGIAGAASTGLVIDLEATAGDLQGSIS